MEAKYFTAFGGGSPRGLSKPTEQADANQHRNVMLGKAQQNGGLLYVEHGRQSPQVEQFLGLCRNKLWFAIRLCGQRFVDFAIHNLPSVNEMATVATWVFSAAV